MLQRPQMHADIRRPSQGRRPGTMLLSGGFGLVEVMVGLVVGLISMVVVMQLYSNFEGQKRSTTSGSDAQSNGAIALFLMEREVKMGGNAISEGVPREAPPLTGCTAFIIDEDAGFWRPSLLGSTVTTAGAVAQIRLAPAIISDGGGGVSDSLSIVYGTSAISAPYALAGTYAAGITSLNLISNSGIAAGDMLALIQENPPVPVVPKSNYRLPWTCAILQAAGPGILPGQVVIAAASRYNPETGFTTAGNVNGGTFQGANYAKAYNLGQLNIVTYRIVNGNLVADTSKFGVIPAGGGAVANSTIALPLASNIVNMQVQYGVDTGNATGACAAPITPIDSDAIVDAWVDATGIWANNAGGTTPIVTDIRRIRAVRVALIARSGVLEKDCATNPPTPNAIVIGWGSGPAMNPDLTGDANWQCYRYKVFQTTINLRNATWSSTMNPASNANCNP